MTLSHSVYRGSPRDRAEKVSHLRAREMLAAQANNTDINLKTTWYIRVAVSGWLSCSGMMLAQGKGLVKC